MKERVEAIFKDSMKVKEGTLNENSDKIIEVVNFCITALKNGNKLLICGNGGSAADSQHFAAEMIGRFQEERISLPAIALTTDTSALTALGNDYGYDSVFARQVEGLAKEGDVAFGISTSGNSSNVVAGMEQARKQGCKTVALTGGDGGKLNDCTDINIIVPSKVIARIQESHICIIHTVCELVEKAFS